MATRTQIKTQYIIWFMLLSIILAGCLNQSPLYPTYEELKNHGFYIYVLPETIVTQKQWQQEIYIWSFDRHCRNLGNEANNPLEVSYYKKDETVSDNTPRKSLLSIEMGNSGWVPPYASTNEKGEMIDIVSPFIIGRALHYYPDDKTRSTLMFTDTFGVRVYVTAGFPLTETLAIIQQLEYIGPDTNTLTISPWVCKK